MHEPTSRGVFRAPGKVLILGEYAVLDGAAAVVAAVDSGVQCEVTEAPELTLETPGDDRFVRGALESARAIPARYRFTAYNPMPTAELKPGLGASAAAVVCALLAALSTQGRAADPATLYRRGLAVHHAVQGSGSGVDVAASAFGGIHKFKGGQIGPWQPLDFLVIWSGRSSRTGPLLERYLRWDKRHGFAVLSDEVVDQFYWEPIEAMRKARRLLQYMARKANLAYRTPELDAIARLAEAHGGAAKPSGAGGGDCAVALLPDPEAEAAFRLACEAAGFPVLPLKVARAAGMLDPHAAG